MSKKKSECNDLIEVIRRRNDPILRLHEERIKILSGPPIKRRRELSKEDRSCVVCGTSTNYVVYTGHLKLSAMCSQRCHDQFDRENAISPLKPADKYHSYLSGWRTAAGIRVIPKEIAEHTNPLVREEWQAGYSAGVRARNDAQKEASDRSGYWPADLSLQLLDD